MKNTPKWDQFCEVYNIIGHTREQMQKYQKKIIQLVQEDMNKSTQNNTKRILEENTDFEDLKEILKPLLHTISRIEWDKNE